MSRGDRARFGSVMNGPFPRAPARRMSRVHRSIRHRLCPSLIRYPCSAAPDARHASPSPDSLRAKHCFDVLVRTRSLVAQFLRQAVLVPHPLHLAAELSVCHLGPCGRSAQGATSAVRTRAQRRFVPSSLHTVVDGVRLGLWAVTDHGIAFLTIEPESDAIDFYSFGDRKVRRLGRLRFVFPDTRPWVASSSIETADGPL
jgi:hypothetical protein